MIDALFWYTGLLAWVFNLLAGAVMLAAVAHDRFLKGRTTRRLSQQARRR
jgi:hypothetical protein